MLVVRGTQKLRDRLKKAPAAPADAASTTALGDWFANDLGWRPQVALLVNRRTLLPVLVPLAPAATLLDRIPAAILDVLRRHGADDEFLAEEAAAMSKVVVAPTDDRRVLGVMNEYANVAGWEDREDLPGASVNLARLILGPLEYGNARDELASAIGLPMLAKIIPLRPRKSDVDVFRLRITLLDTDPAIWRTVLVAADTTFGRLHDVIQAAFGWSDSHLHAFEVHRKRYGRPDLDDGDDDDEPFYDERHTHLDDVVNLGHVFTYTYDFGDDWRHRISVEEVDWPDDDLELPLLVDGARACPPEDCGGPPGYQELVAILEDPSHPEHQARVEWLGPFDPTTFDPSRFDRDLRNAKVARFDRR